MEELQAAWERRIDDPDGLLRAIEEMNEASSALALAWNKEEEAAS
jgi:hypothetical protein